MLSLTSHHRHLCVRDVCNNTKPCQVSVLMEQTRFVKCLQRVFWTPDKRARKLSMLKSDVTMAVSQKTEWGKLRKLFNLSDEKPQKTDHKMLSFVTSALLRRSHRRKPFVGQALSLHLWRRFKINDISSCQVSFRDKANNNFSKSPPLWIANVRGAESCHRFANFNFRWGKRGARLISFRTSLQRKLPTFSISYKK